MEFKFIIVGPQDRSLSKIIENIELKNDNLIIARHFTNNKVYENTENVDNLYYLDNTTISSSIKNNSILYVYSNDNNTTGVTIDEFYNSNIISMSLVDFNNISTNLLNMYKDNMLIVWLDTAHHLNNDTLNVEINEVNYLLNKINNFNYNYIYLLDENVETISDIIIDYYTANNDHRKQILEDYS